MWFYKATILEAQNLIFSTLTSGVEFNISQHIFQYSSNSTILHVFNINEFLNFPNTFLSLECLHSSFFRTISNHSDSWSSILNLVCF